MTQPFAYDPFLSHNAKDKAAVRAPVAAIRQSAAFSSGNKETSERKVSGALPSRRHPEEIEDRLEHSRTLMLTTELDADGELRFTLPDVLKRPPISNHGTVGEIMSAFGAPDKLRIAVGPIQSLFYEA